jgi:hypothetical protein
MTDKLKKLCQGTPPPPFYSVREQTVREILTAFFRDVFMNLKLTYSEDADKFLSIKNLSLC